MSVEAPSPVRRTPLFPFYSRYGARVVDFHGWDLPVQFSGIIDEHQAVRERAGLFDVSHMGEIEIAGADSLDLVQKLTINDAAQLRDGQVQYSAMCNPDGGIVDDITVFRFSPERFLLCVNAANTGRDLDWIRQHRRGETRVEDASDRTALLAVQGPLSERILAPLSELNLSGLAYYHFASGRVAGIPAVVSRTGYTGEDGFEIFLPSDRAGEVWEGLLNADGIQPAGLGARDTLRLEVKYLLYGNDINADTDPWEAGLSWITKPGKGDFIGREALLRRQKAGLRRRLAGFVLQGRGVARSGYPILDQGRRIGEVTSGTYSPSLKTSIGLGYVPRESSAPGTAVSVEIRGSAVPAEIVKTPFYRGGSIKKH